MPIVNYVREHTRFIEYASDERLTSGERLLWYALMHVMNQRAQGRDWPEGFIRIANERLFAYTGLKFDALAAARNKLKQRGLIEFIPGKGSERGGLKSESPLYRICYFYPVQIPSESDRPEKTDGMGDGLGYGPGDGPGYGVGDGMGDISINYTRDKPIPYPEEDDEEEEEGSSSYARAREETVERWRRSYGRTPSRGMTDLIAGQAARLGFEDGVIGEAIREACEANAQNPAKYILTLFADWRDFGVRTGDEAVEYLNLRDSARNGTGFERDMAVDELKKLREAKQ